MGCGGGERCWGGGLQEKEWGMKEALMWDLPTRSLLHKDLREASGREVIGREELQVAKVALEIRGWGTSENS